MYAIRSVRGVDVGTDASFAARGEDVIALRQAESGRQLIACDVLSTAELRYETMRKMRLITTD